MCPSFPGLPAPWTTWRRPAPRPSEIGYPVIIKAAAGGGGKGMRVAESADVIENTFTMARNEAAAAFNDARVYIERFVQRTRATSRSRSWETVTAT